MITVFSDNKEISTNYLQHSDGAITYKLEGMVDNPRYISINVDPKTPVSVIREELLMITECISQLVDDKYFSGNVPLTLNLPYLPYARNDRVFEKGNPNGLLSFLMSLDDIKGFDEIHTCDIHNRGAVDKICYEYALPLNIVEKPQLECYKSSLPCDFNEEYDYIVAPDAGSMDKARTIAGHLETNIIFAGKKRDVSTGRILETTLPEYVDLSGAKVLIPDDIGDGMGTFIFLAKALRERGVKEIHLYVTHLIGAKGLKVLTGHIDKLYCYQTVSDYVNKQNVTDFNIGNYVK